MPAPAQPAPTPAVLTIRNRLDIPSAKPDRFGKADAFITYQIEGGRPRLIVLSAESVTDDAIRAAVKADQAEAASWMNRQIKL